MAITLKAIETNAVALVLQLGLTAVLVRRDLGLWFLVLDKLVGKTYCYSLMHSCESVTVPLTITETDCITSKLARGGTRPQHGVGFAYSASTSPTWGFLVCADRGDIYRTNVSSSL